MFNPKDGFIDRPLQVPCGKCFGCMSDRARIWGVRIYHEASQHDRSCFVTLTYRDPAPESINKRDIQLFIKRLRRYSPLRYFACGEYGERTRRPHYHLVLFGEDFRGGSYSISDTLYGSPVIDAAWERGFTSIGDVSIGAAMYVAGYATKKLGDPDTFTLMSRRPGIGHSWLDKYHDDIADRGFVTIEGKRYPIPRTYMDRYPEDFEDLRRTRRSYVESLSPDQRWFKREHYSSREKNYKATAARRIEAI